MADPEDFFKDQLPVAYWPTITTTLQTAYAAANNLAKDNPILQVKSAVDNFGRLVSWAVDLGLENAIKHGSLPCDYRWMPFAKPTGRYIELRFSHSTASVSQVKDPQKQPRSVVFRENARLRHPDLLSSLEKDAPLIGAPRFILVHGYQNLNFAHFGAPSSASKTQWSWLSQNLMRLPHELPSEGPDTENTDINLDELNLLKEDIERWMKDNGSL